MDRDPWPVRRRTLACHYAMRAIRSKSKSLISIMQSNPTPSMTYDEFFLSYRLHIGDLTREAKLQTARQGKLPGPAPLGYLNRRTGKYETAVVMDDATAPLVREAFGLAAQGWTVRALAAEMDARGLRSRNGNALRASALWHLLTNPFYAGFVRYGGETFPGRHEPLVEEDLFVRVQEGLRGRSKRGY